MPSRRAFIQTWLGAPLLGIENQPIPLAEGAQQAIAVVTHSSAALRELSLRDLRRLYTAERIFGPDDKQLIPFNHPRSSAIRERFDQTVLEMSPDEVSRFWIDRKIRGQRGAPRAVPSTELLAQVVAKLPGAVSYLLEADVPRGLRVVAIDGKLPSDAEYALR